MSNRSIKEKAGTTSNNDLFKVAEITISYSHKSDPSKYPQIKSSQDAYAIFMDIWDNSTIDILETMYMLLLNRANRVLGVMKLSQGGVTGTIVDAKIIFSTALKAGASGIILSHNHPSGNLSPSKADRDISDNIYQAGKLLEIQLLDHLIVTRHGYTSFADENLFIPF